MDQRVEWLPPATPTPASQPTMPEDVGLPPAEPRTGWRRLLGPLAVVGAILAKFKGVLLLLPKLKILTTSGSMLVSVAAYSLIWGWQFAAGFVLLLLVHEMGHVIQLRREGIEASAPTFIPFLGAVVAAKSLGDDAAAEARVGLAGPILGSIGAALLIPVWLATDNEFWQALAFTGFFLNLFNLLPVIPLDGGRAMAAMAPWMWFVGFAALVALTIAFPNPILLIVLLFGGMETWRRWRQRRAGGQEQEAYYSVTPRARAAVAAVYVGLIVALAVGMDLSHVQRTLG
ncbi:MAG TPA: site-2 protease family protein [Conexibacter sp.]|nr:site-2 protease family protein [Conexibacter sp.]